jgi:flagella basal body P-ring formation protein FlgA
MQTLSPPTRARVNGDRRSAVELPRSRRRRVPLAVAAALGAVACALLFALLYRSAGERDLVLVVQRDVPAGRTITADDLATRQVSTDGGIATVPAGQRSAVIGQAAAVDLVAGGLLSASQVGPPRDLADGEAIVALALPDGETPTVADGDTVQLVLTDAAGEGGSGGEVIAEARVVEVAVDGGGSLSVSVAVDERRAAEIASAAAADRVRLVRVAGR